MRVIPYAEVATLVTERLAQGDAFLTSTNGAESNVMTIGWGSVSCIFNVGVFMAVVRTSRHTYDLLQQRGEFVISIPLHDMKKALAFAGTKSGRDVNKFEGHGMTAAPAQQVSAPIVEECELHLECRVVGKVPFRPEMFEQQVLDRWYPDRDMHTLFMGEIVKCYYTND